MYIYLRLIHIHFYTSNPNRWIRLLLSREVVGWENVVQLWDFFFEMSSMSRFMLSNQVENRPHIGLMELCECASASMIILLREPLLRPTPLNGANRHHDSSDKIDLLVNYPPLQDLSLLKDHIIFMTHQLHVMRKHDGSNPLSPKDFFFVQSPQRPKNTDTNNTKERIINQNSNRYKNWALNLKPPWGQQTGDRRDEKSDERTADDIELMPSDAETNKSPFRVLQKNSSRLLKSVWDEASRKMMGTLDSVDPWTPERKKAGDRQLSINID